MSQLKVRARLLDEFTKQVFAAAATGLLLKGKPVRLAQMHAVNGPRVGAIEIDAGMYARDILAALDDASVRQLVPWAFVGNPFAYMPPGSRRVRIEAGWPSDLALNDIPLSSLGAHPKSPDSFIVGQNESGVTVVTSFDDAKPTYLVGGAPGGGKTWSLRAMVAQLSGAAWGMVSGTRFVLIDGKQGEGLGPVSSLPGVVGPLATSVEDAGAALAWAKAEMDRRYQQGYDTWSVTEKRKAGRIVVVVDELYPFISDTGILTLLRELGAQGRAADVNLVVVTHHPTIKVLGDATLKNVLVARWGFYVTGYKASEVIFGGSGVRAERLQGAGDTYLQTPRGVQRMQATYVEQARLATYQGHKRLLEEWPRWDGAIAQSGAQRFSAQEVGLAMTVAMEQGGGSRTKVKDAVHTATGNRPGSTRASDLLTFAKGALGTAYAVNGSMLLPRKVGH